MTISPLWCSLMSVSLFNTLMMEVKDVGEIMDRVRIQTQCDFGYLETFLFGLGMHQLSCVGILVVVDGNVNR